MIPFLGRGNLGKERAMRLAMAGKPLMDLSIQIPQLNLWFSWNQGIIIRYGNNVLLLIT